MGSFAATTATTTSSAAAHAAREARIGEAYPASCRIPVSSSKPESYFAQARPELVALLPAQLGRVLDIGCGAGGVGRAIRDRADRLTGIELDPVAAERARDAYDEVHTGAVDEVLEQVEGPFDTVLAYDVLEHLADPSAVLRRGACARGTRRASPRLRSERAALVARARSRPPWHVRLHRDRAS